MGSIASSERFYKHPKCTPKDDYEHRPFVATNETRQHNVIEALCKTPMEGNAIVGVGGFYILNIASISRPRSAKSIEVIALIDRGVRVLDFWKCAEEIIRTSDSRLDVIAKIKELLVRKSSQYFKRIGNDLPVETQAHIEILGLEISLKCSWLSSDIQFQRIKRIFDNRCFFFFQADFFDPEQIEDISGILKEANVTIDTAYLANLSEYSEKGERASFATAMQKLITPRTHVISAHFSTPFEFPMQFLRHTNEIPMRKFLFPDVKDITEFTPTRGEAAMIKFCKLVQWMDEHRPLVTKVSVVCWAVAAVYLVNRCLAYFA